MDSDLIKNHFSCCILDKMFTFLVKELKLNLLVEVCLTRRGSTRSGLDLQWARLAEGLTPRGLASQRARLAESHKDYF